jgi:hypothetical protein
MYVCIDIRHTNNHHIALQTEIALLGDFVHCSVHQAGVNTMYEDSNTTEVRRVDCLTSFKTSCAYHEKAW